MYAKGKQFWLFWGLIRIGKISVATPVDGSCEIVVKSNFGDAVVSGLTCGIVSSKTIKVNDKKKENVQENRNNTENNN